MPTLDEIRTLTQQYQPTPEEIQAGRERFLEGNSRMKEVLATAEAAILESAKRGVYCAEVAVNDSNEYHFLANYYQAQHYRTAVGGCGRGGVLEIWWDKQ